MRSNRMRGEQRRWHDCYESSLGLGAFTHSLAYTHWHYIVFLVGFLCGVVVCIWLLEFGYVWLGRMEMKMWVEGCVLLACFLACDIGRNGRTGSPD